MRPDTRHRPAPDWQVIRMHVAGAWISFHRITLNLDQAHAGPAPPDTDPFGHDI
jgi:hypothetical protein